MTEAQPTLNSHCPLCGTPTEPRVLAEVGWQAPPVIQRLVQVKPNWKPASGACPACVQQALLRELVEQGEAALRAGLQDVWPLDAEAVYGALPTPMRLHADPRFDGQGLTIALVDAGFYPHPDLTQPRNRIRAWVDAGQRRVAALTFAPGVEPRWPGWDSGAAAQWHGLMTSTVAAGNGWLSHGLYRGIASGADLVLVQVRDAAGHITNQSLARGLRWLAQHGPQLDVRVVNLSVGGDPVTPLAGNVVDTAIATLVARGMTVTAAAGNDGVRQLVPPATAPAAVTVGGLDDHNIFDEEAVNLWHSNYGAGVDGSPKPELVAPSMWVAAPLLPDTPEANRARYLFARRAAQTGDAAVESQIEFNKLLSPYYQHVEGTSFAAPVVASLVACMLQANPRLTPLEVRRLLLVATQLVPGAPEERQGHGAIQGGQAVALAVASRAGWPLAEARSPVVTGRTVVFRLHADETREVHVLGSWDGWRQPGLSLEQPTPGWWQGQVRDLAPGEYQYKFVCDGQRWLADPANTARASDTYGGWNSVVTVARD